MLAESLACSCLCVQEQCFQAAGHGLLCDGANQIVVRNSQGPLREAERREELEDGGRGRGGLSHDDIVKQIRPGLPLSLLTPLCLDTPFPVLLFYKSHAGLWGFLSMCSNQRV